MDALTKWMLTLALVAVSGTAIAAQQPNKFESAAGNLGCRAPVHCVPAVKPNLKPHTPPPHLTPPPPPPRGVGNVQHVGTTNNPPGTAGTKPGSNSSSQGNGSNQGSGSNQSSGSNQGSGTNQGSGPGPGTFTCGQVVSGYTVSCTTNPPTNPPNPRVSAPEIDASGAVNGTVLVMGCLAILHARRRRMATLTGR